MKSAKVVIGSNYGDEGKGLITDYYSTPDSIVVRFNGGAQAGHTVCLPDGRRHEFHHFGSGTLQGAATYLGPKFVCNPIVFVKELRRLNDQNINPLVFANPKCLVSTPYDMILNQVLENSRGKTRHGSVGLGFGETVERNLNPKYVIKAEDKEIRSILLSIRTEYLPERLSKLNLVSQYSSILNTIDQGVIDRFVDEFEYFQKITHFSKKIPGYKKILFEGAQGLLLDQDSGHYFPHVTRSNTGIKNAAEIASEIGIDHLDITYVTRTYITRHGPGPLENELPEKPFSKIVDETNVQNFYQGELRFAYIDVDLMKRSIENDLLQAPTWMETSHKLAITCMDQLDEKVRFYHKKNLLTSSHDSLISALVHSCDGSLPLISQGPTRNDISEWK